MSCCDHLSSVICCLLFLHCLPIVAHNSKKKIPTELVHASYRKIKIDTAILSLIGTKTAPWWRRGVEAEDQRGRVGRVARKTSLPEGPPAWICQPQARHDDGQRACFCLEYFNNVMHTTCVQPTNMVRLK